jgi:hypothetical protein
MRVMRQLADARERIMDETSAESGSTDEDILTREIPDAALEAAAGVERCPARAFTAALCTVLADCPT